MTPSSISHLHMTPTPIDLDSNGKSSFSLAGGFIGHKPSVGGSYSDLESRGLTKDRVDTCPSVQGGVIAWHRT